MKELMEALGSILGLGLFFGFVLFLCGPTEIGIVLFVVGIIGVVLYQGADIF